MAVTAIHPGQHLAEELKELGMSAAELAGKLDVPTNRITGILNGQPAITGIPPCGWRIFLALARSSGLTCGAFMKCVSRKREWGAIRALPRLKLSERVPA